MRVIIFFFFFYLKYACYKVDFFSVRKASVNLHGEFRNVPDGVCARDRAPRKGVIQISLPEMRDTGPRPRDDPEGIRARSRKSPRARSNRRRTCARITQPHCPSAKSTAREVRDTPTSRKHDRVRYGLRCHASIRRAERMHVARAPPAAAPIRGRPALPTRAARCHSKPTSDARRNWTGKSTRNRIVFRGRRYQVPYLIHKFSIAVLHVYLAARKIVRQAGASFLDPNNEDRI